MRSGRHRKATGLKRRDVLVGAGSLATGATLTFPAPTIAQGFRQLKMVTDWTDTMPGLLSASRRLAQTIEEVTKGRIKIEVFPANSFVAALETFDAVSEGLADMYHSYDGYFEKKSSALTFYCGVPFGFTANCSPGSVSAVVRNCGINSLVNSISSRSSSSALEHRWAAGSGKR